MFNQINARIEAVGWDFKCENLELDGEAHNNLKTDKFSGGYVGSIKETDQGETIVTLTAWDWRGEKQSFYQAPEKLSTSQKARIKDAQALEAAKIRKAKISLQEEIGARAREQWAEMFHVEHRHDYLHRKGLLELGVGLDGGSFLGAKVIHPDQPLLVIPTKDHLGKIWGMQRIYENGDKRFMDGQKTDGMYHLMGELHGKGVLYICEGFATAASIHLSTGKTCAVAFSSQNFAHLGEILRSTYPALKLVFCGDEDIWKRNPKNGDLYLTGRKAALKAATSSQGSVLPPCFKHLDQEVRDTERPTDFNDLYILSAKNGGSSRAEGIGPDWENGKKEVQAQVQAHYETDPLEYIGTELTGFYHAEWDKDIQNFVYSSANPDDLCKYFARFNNYCVQEQGQRPYVYRGGVWKSLHHEYFLNYAERHFVQDCGETLTCNNNLAAEFKGKILRRNFRDGSWFDSTTERKVNFINGVLDLDSGAFGDSSPSYGFRTQLPYEYNPEAKCPEWEKVMGRVSCGDRGLVEMMEQFFGYCLSSDRYWLHKSLILVGEGSNGKSTVLDTVRALLGPENCASLTLSDLGQEYNRAMLDGKLACISEENEQKEQDFGSNNAFKNLASGGTIRARSPYEKPYDFVNRAKFLFAFNRFDRVGDNSHGMSRRLLIAPFNARFEAGGEGFNPNIKGVLQSELSGIFNRCYAAYNAMRESGQIKECAASKDAVREIIRESDSVSVFCDEFVEQIDPALHPNRLTILANFYQEYKIWSDRNGRYPVCSSTFTKRVIRLYDPPGGVLRRRIDGKQVKCLSGLKYISQD